MLNVPHVRPSGAVGARALLQSFGSAPGTGRVTMPLVWDAMVSSYSVRVFSSDSSPRPASRAGGASAGGPRALRIPDVLNRGSARRQRRIERPQDVDEHVHGDLGIGRGDRFARIVAD